MGGIVKSKPQGRKAIAALDRAAYFAQPGATPAGWRGGPRLVQKDRKREASKRACRGGWE